jgi:D-allulose-6-phosphate 3-epimerase
MKLKEQIDVLDKYADFLHVDIMDGHFVKNITLSPMFVTQIRDYVRLPIDCHLMVENPNDFIDPLLQAGTNYITLQIETINKDAFRTINRIHDAGCKVGIILNPATTLDTAKHYLSLIDKLTILTVDPGFAGQKFVTNMLDKIREASDIKKRNNYSYLIEIDGSCNAKTFSVLAKAGAEVFIVGTSGLFGLDDDLEIAWKKMIERFDNCIKF